MIEFGSTQYFGLLDFQDKLRCRSFDKFGLESLDKLRYEVHIKIKSIEMARPKVYKA